MAFNLWPRAGSWGTPEYGLTEKVQSLFNPGGALTYQQGSNLLGAQPLPDWTGSYGVMPKTLPIIAPTVPGGSPGGLPNLPTSLPAGQLPPQQITNAFTPTSGQDLNATYDPYYSGLTQQEGQAKTDYEALLGSLSQNEALTQEDINLQKKTQEAELGRQTIQTQQYLGNALSQARQIFNELSQYNQARFGTGTSAGPAAMELLGRETQRQMGSAQTQAGNIEAEINDRRNQLTEFTDQEIRKVKQSYNDERMKASQLYNTRMVAISSNRSMLDSQKAQAQYQLTENYKQFFRSLEQWRIESVVGYDLWNQQQQAALNKTKADMPTSLNPDVFYSQIFPIEQTGKNIVRGAAPQQLAQNYYIPRGYNPTYATKKKEEDIINNVNPFA